jgi:septal ring factor EnvC (AmiA/AmiB activator)
MPDSLTGGRGQRKPLGSLLIAGFVAAGMVIAEFVTGAPCGSAQAQNQLSSDARQPAVLAMEVRQELKDIRAQLIETARRTQAQETVVEQAEQQLAGLEAHHTVRARALSGLRGKLSGLIGALQRLARRPPEAILTSPRPPLASARAMMLIQHLVPMIKGQTDKVHVELTQIEALNHQIRTEKARFHAASAALETRWEQLDTLIERKNTLWLEVNGRLRPSAAQLEELVESVASLAALFTALREQDGARADATERLSSLIKNAPRIQSDPSVGVAQTANKAQPAVTPTRPSDQPGAALALVHSPAPARIVPSSGSIRAHKGHLTFPAIGRLAERFGETDALGLTARGITLFTRPNAPVLASHDGKVIYAGPFRGYGRIIIIEHGLGFLTLLAGLGRIEVQPGQGVLEGEPVGRMSGVKVNGQESAGQLYIELRQDGAPVDPLAWLSTQRNTAIQ